MGLADRFDNKLVFIDTAPFIYLIEKNHRYFNLVNELITLSEANVSFCTSSITLLEVLVMPFKLNESRLAKEYEKILLNSVGLNVYDVDIDIARKGAELRAKYNLRTLDAIQLSTSLTYRCDFFITNDLALNKVTEVYTLTFDQLLQDQA